MEFAEWALQATLIWCGLLAVVDIALKLTVERQRKERLLSNERGDNDDTDW